MGVCYFDGWSESNVVVFNCLIDKEFKNGRGSICCSSDRVDLLSFIDEVWVISCSFLFVYWIGWGIFIKCEGFDGYGWLDWYFL